MFLTSVWANEKNEAALSAHCFHTSNSAVRTVIYWSDIGKGHFECQLWIPGDTPLDIARQKGHTEIVNLLMGAASWLHGWGSMQWPNGIVGGNIHGWNLVGMKTWKAYQGCLRIRCWTHDSWSLKTHCQIITSHRPTGQQLSTGEPRIWLNLQNWFGENTSDYQIMHGQNRHVYFLRLTFFSTTWPKGHRLARTGVGSCLMFLLSISIFGVE